MSIGDMEQSSAQAYLSGGANAAPCVCEANRSERQRIAAALAAERVRDAANHRRVSGEGEVLGQGVAQQRRAPGRLFARSDILAILKAQRALSLGSPAEMKERDMLNALTHIFENLE